MKRHIFPMGIVLTVLVVAWSAAGQQEQGGARREQFQNIRERWEDMSEEEREEFRARMRQGRESWENLSPEEREKRRAEVRERLGSGPARIGRQEQLKAVKAIEAQVAKLKAALESSAPEARSRLRDLSEEERAKMRKDMIAAMRQRQTAIRAIDEELAKLRGPVRPSPESRMRIGELKQIYDLAVKENATETARRLERLMAGYPDESRGRSQPGETRPRRDVQRPQRDRPARPPRPGSARDAERGRPAPAFTLKSFDGKTVSLSEFRGKTVVLEWFNFECPFVQHHYKEAGTMTDLAAKYKDKNVVWLAVNSTSHTTPQANREVAAQHKLAYPILDDRSGTVGRAYGAKTTPHMFVIGPEGKIVYDGAIDNSPLGRTAPGQEPANYVDKTLAALTTGRDVGTATTKPYGCSVKYPK
ncbi:MAG: redoxin domain-containing protein [Phycisphaerales bacterium]|nr:MAG: redoxin domain-containing protein [Phycisphaerales bacterium]